MFFIYISGKEFALYEVRARDKIKDTDMKKFLILTAISAGIVSISLFFSGCYTQLTADRFEQSVYAEHSVPDVEPVDTSAAADTSGYDDEYQPDYSSWYYYYPRWNSSWYDGYAYAPPGSVIYGDGWCYSGFYSPWWWGPACTLRSILDMAGTVILMVIITGIMIMDILLEGVRGGISGLDAPMVLRHAVLEQDISNLQCEVM